MVNNNLPKKAPNGIRTRIANNIENGYRWTATCDGYVSVHAISIIANDNALELMILDSSGNTVLVQTLHSSGSNNYGVINTLPINKGQIALIRALNFVTSTVELYFTPMS